MAKRTVFNDEENNELDCYINDKGKVYMSISQPGEDIAYSGHITLNKEDVKDLIDILKDLEESM